MTRYEYKVTLRSADEFTELIYFCTPEGKCDVERVPVAQIKKVGDILNEEGQTGWELVQVAFGKDGVIMFWKRNIPDGASGQTE